jgi:hypothetical protein
MMERRKSNQLPGVPVEPNPYSPPKAEVRDVFDPEMDQERVQRLRSGQKLAIYAILIYLVTLIVQMSLAGAPHSPRAPGLLMASGFVLMAGGLAALIMSLMGVWKMGYGLGVGTILRVVMLIFMIVPVINILLLLIVNARATRKLRQAGYKVGFLGVSGRTA